MSYMRDALGRRLDTFAVADGPSRVQPSTAVEVYGDSLAASTWEDEFATATGLTTTARGVSGQAVADVLTRLGALRPFVTLDGNAIPATTTAVTVTSIDPATGWRTNGSGSFSFGGTLKGVPGTLSHNLVTDVWTFTRTTAGSVVAVPAGTQFLPTDPGHLGSRVIVQASENNVSNGTMTAAGDLLAAVPHALTSRARQYMVVGILNGPTEGRATATYRAKVALNTRLAAEHGLAFLDLRRGMIDRGLELAGQAPVAQDLLDIAEDRIPSSLMADNTHPNAAGQLAEAMLIAEKAVELGWVASMTYAYPRTVITSDSFSRVDTTSGTVGAADVAYGGTTQTPATDSQVGIVGGRLGAVTTLTANRKVLYNAASPDHRVKMTLVASLDDTRIYARYTDTSNFYQLLVNATLGRIELSRRLAGATAPMASSRAGVVAPGSTVELKVSGTTITGYANGQPVVQVTNTDLVTGNLCGPVSPFAGATWLVDDVIVTAS